MGQAHYAFEGVDDEVSEPRRLPLAVSIFADRAHLREEMREDALAAGLRIGQCGPLSLALESEALPMGEAVLLDCPQVDAAMLAALSRLDMRVARTAARMVVSTSVEALEDVFACLDQSEAQILVDPRRSERLIALGRMLGSTARMRLRELSEEDRLTLLRLTEQVEQIAQKLDGLQIGGGMTGPGINRDVPVPEGGTLAENALSGEVHAGDDGSRQTRRGARPSLPDPRLVRRIIRQRQLRNRFFDSALFADPAWDILLDLTAARAEHMRVSVTSLCIASGVPPTTALRWISQMTEAGLLVRVEDQADRRRAFIALADKAADAMARYFAEMGKMAAEMV